MKVLKRKQDNQTIIELERSVCLLDKGYTCYMADNNEVLHVMSYKTHRDVFKYRLWDNKVEYIDKEYEFVDID